MVGIILITIFEVALILVALKTGWLISIMSNIPFIENVIQVVSDYVGVTTGTAQNAAMAFGSEFIKNFLFLILFGYIERLIEYLFWVGKHEYVSPLRRILLRPVVGVAKYFFAAYITALVMTFLSDFVLGIFQGNAVLTGISMSLIIVLALVATFFFMKLDLVNYCIWMLLYMVIPTTVKMIALEFLVVFAYYILNVPGVFEQVGSIAFMSIGIACCIGAALGAGSMQNRVGRIWLK